MGLISMYQSSQKLAFYTFSEPKRFVFNLNQSRGLVYYGTDLYVETKTSKVPPPAAAFKMPKNDKLCDLDK